MQESSVEGTLVPERVQRCNHSVLSSGVDEELESASGLASCFFQALEAWSLSKSEKTK